ncbi:helix-turn-helix domain-containing protein [Candidatus Micrarchaeota archaeon]|nr:helix-turn-helix domain-containing protein [Candidatus Micrarchaeota archaeon]
MKWQKLVKHFWAIKGGAKSSSDKVVVKDAVLLGESNSVKDPRFKKKKFVSEVGRPNSLDVNKLKELLRLYYSYPYSFRELADMFGVSRMTVWRAVQTTQALVTTR